MIGKRYTLAVDLGGTRIKAGLLDGESLIDSVTAGAVREKGLGASLPLVKENLTALQKDNGVSGEELLGIGFSFPGLVDSVRNRVISTNKKYDDAPDLDLEAWSKEQLQLPLFLENDARMSLLGEWRYGAGRGIDDLVMITLGTGIGSAVILEGKLLRGRHFQAGNLGGHFTVNYNGGTCTCGNLGCMEAEASTWRLPALIRHHPEYGSNGLRDEPLLDFETLFRYVSAEDRVATDVLDHCYAVWSAGVISLIHAYDPEAVLLGGGIMESSDRILPELQERVNRNAWTPWGNVRLLKAEQVHTAALFGADYLVRNAQIHTSP